MPEVSTASRSYLLTNVTLDVPEPPLGSGYQGLVDFVISGRARYAIVAALAGSVPGEFPKRMRPMDMHVMMGMRDRNALLDAPRKSRTLRELRLSGLVVAYSKQGRKGRRYGLSALGQSIWPSISKAHEAGCGSRRCEPWMDLSELERMYGQVYWVRRSHQRLPGPNH